MRTVLISPSLIRRRAGGRQKLIDESHCRLCGREHAEFGKVVTGSRQLSRHHLVPERWFRHQPLNVRELRNVDANIIPLCRPCHDEIEHPEASRRSVARRLLRPLLAQDEITFAIQMLGKPWLDRSYPLSGEKARDARREPVGPGHHENCELDMCVEACDVLRQERRVRRQRTRHAPGCQPGRCVSSCEIWLSYGPTSMAS